MHAGLDFPSLYNLSPVVVQSHDSIVELAEFQDREAINGMYICVYILLS